MKRYGYLIVALALAALVSTAAWARGPMGAGGGYGGGPGYGYSQVAPAQQEAWAKFQNDTLELRKQLAARNVELRTLYSQPNPDQARVQTLTQEISNLRAQIGQKATEAGFGYGSGFGPGYGTGGYGPGHARGYGMGGGYCWR